MNNVIGIIMIILFVMVNRKEILDFFKELNLLPFPGRQKKVGQLPSNVEETQETQGQSQDSNPDVTTSKDDFSS